MTFPSLSNLSCPNPKKSSSMGTLLHWDDHVQVSHFSGLFSVPLWFLAVHGQLFSLPFFFSFVCLLMEMFFPSINLSFFFIRVCIHWKKLFIFSHKTRLLDYLSLRCIWYTSFVIFSHRWVACISSERILSQGASGTTSTHVMVLLTGFLGNLQHLKRDIGFFFFFSLVLPRFCKQINFSLSVRAQ